MLFGRKKDTNNNKGKTKETRHIKENNITPGDLAELKWDPQNEMESLEKYKSFVTNKAKEVIDWYLERKSSKKWWAQRLRLFAVIFATIGGIIPILSGIFEKLDASWSAVVLAVAAACVMIDKLFGFSNSWMRFISTELEVQTRLDDFLMEWIQAKAKLKDTDPTPEERDEFLKLCRNFLTNLDRLIQEESKLWIQEFKGALAQIDKQLQQQITSVKRGGINITVTNYDQIQEGSGKVRLDGDEKNLNGKTVAYKDKFAGRYKVTIEGNLKDNGNEKPATIEKLVEIKEDSITTAEMTLE